jgi:signal transduction histidine kinase
MALINYINKTNRELARFFAALKDKDSSTHIHFNDNKGAFKELASTLNDIAEIIGKSRIESEKSSKYFEFVVEHIPIGLLTINRAKKIIHSNKAIKVLLQTESLNNLKKIELINQELCNEIDKIKPGEQKIIRVKLQNQFIQILIRSTQFRYEDEELKLISLQDVKNELEENELISWQKLIRVLTHEIMNSITPISTLTLAIKKCLNGNDINDALYNTELIEERSIGLQSFVEKYRSLTKIQSLKTKQFSVHELLDSLISLFKNEIQKQKIEITIDVKPENLSLDADEKLIEQVVINLIKNAIESLLQSNEKKIGLSAYYNAEKRIEIKVSDSGHGITDEEIDQIFIPFYTTKKQGSGIGLSLARQIMRLHSGNISVQSVPNKETTFTLLF